MICLSHFPVATWICRIPSTTRDKLASNSPQMTNTSAVPSKFTTKMHKSKLLRKILEPAPSIWRNLHCQCHYSIKFYDPVNSVLLLHVARHLSFAVMTKKLLVQITLDVIHLKIIAGRTQKSQPSVQGLNRNSFTSGLYLADIMQRIDDGVSKIIALSQGKSS